MLIFPTSIARRNHHDADAGDRYDAGAADRAHGRGVRKEDLRKVPGVAETLDWAATLAGLELHDLRQEPEAVYETMMCLLKTREDRARLTREVSERLLGKVA